MADGDCVLSPYIYGPFRSPVSRSAALSAREDQTIAVISPRRAELSRHLQGDKSWRGPPIHDT